MDGASNQQGSGESVEIQHEWASVVISVFSSLVLFGVSYGIHKTKLERLEEDVKRNQDRIHAGINSEQELRNRVSLEQIALRKEIDAKLETATSEARREYVTFRHFESVVGHLRHEQAEMKTDIKEILSLVSQLRAALRSG